MKKILSSLLIIGIVGALAVGLSSGFFSDTETSQDNTFVAGVVDLGIDNHSFYNGVLNPGTTWRVDYDLSDNPPRQFFNFTDVKPGDWGEDTLSLHVRDNEAWLCTDVTLTSNDDNGITEPEGLDGDATDGAGNGELADSINFYWWADDGDNVLEENEVLLPAGPMGALNVGETTTVALADSQVNIWTNLPNSPLDPANVYFVAKAWCYGDTTMTPYEQDGGNQQSGPDDRPVLCDGVNQDNTTQTDSFTADITFNAVQSRNNPDFLCNPPEPTPTTPPQISCDEVDNIFASSFDANDQGLRKDSTPVLANRSIPSAAFGAPQTSGADSDVGFPAGSFFSLGFPLGGNDASIVFGFPEPFYPNPSGPDLQIFEVTGGTYPDEKVNVEASSTAVGPWTVLALAATRDEDIELSPLTSAQYVRLTDVSNIADFPDDADGYDVDALKAFCTEVSL